MNKKEEEILAIIIKYLKENNTMPTMRYLQKELSYKSINSISRIFKSLEKNNYLKRNKDNKLILCNNLFLYKDNLKLIKIINTKNELVNIILDKRKKHLAYKIHNDYFINDGIFRNDILIIEQKSKLNKDDFGLFIIDNKYRIMKYDYKDGFYILKDKEELLLNRVQILGKVIMIERKL